MLQLGGEHELAVICRQAKRLVAIHKDGPEDTKTGEIAGELWNASPTEVVKQGVNYALAVCRMRPLRTLLLTRLTWWHQIRHLK